MAANCFPALPMFSVPFCFSGGAQTCSPAACPSSLMGADSTGFHLIAVYFSTKRQSWSYP